MKKITNPIYARAAIAVLISEGWQIDLYKLTQTLPDGIKDEDWLTIANGCLDCCLNEMAKDKVIPIFKFSNRKSTQTLST